VKTEPLTAFLTLLPSEHKHLHLPMISSVLIIELTQICLFELSAAHCRALPEILSVDLAQVDFDKTWILLKEVEFLLRGAPDIAIFNMFQNILKAF
jgi:hypothetical protein